MPKDFANYIPLAIVVLIVLRRSGRARKVQVERGWITPALSLIGVVSEMARETLPGPAAIAILAIAALLGLAAGYLSALHTELSYDDSTGHVMSKPTQLGTVLIVVFLLLRVGLDYLMTGKVGPAARFAQPREHGVDLFRLADAALLFSAAMLIGQRLEILRRAHGLIRARKSGASPGP